MMNYYRHFTHRSVEFNFLLHKNGTPFRFTQDRAFDGNLYYVTPLKESRLRWILEIRRLARTGKFTHIHLHASWNNALALIGLLGVAVVKIAHSHSVFPEERIATRFKALSARTVISALAHIKLACSPEAGLQMFGHQFIFLPNSIDYERFRFNPITRAEIRAKLGVLDCERIIGHVGFLSPIKNQQKIIEIAGEMSTTDPNVKVLLVGDNLGTLPTVRAIAERLGLREKVIWIPETTRVEDYLQAMDLFVFPSLYEGFGMALLEAQVSGIPVIASDQIPRTAVISDDVYFLSLAQTARIWANLAQNLLRANHSPQQRFQRSSSVPLTYSAASNAKDLERLYLT